MALINNNFGNVDLLASCIDLDKRLSAIELKDAPRIDAAPKHEWTPKVPTVSERVDGMLAKAAENAPKQPDKK